MNKYECENCSLFIHDERKSLLCPYVLCRRKFILCEACFQKLLFSSQKPHLLRCDNKLFITHVDDQHSAVNLV